MYRHKSFTSQHKGWLGPALMSLSCSKLHVGSFHKFWLICILIPGKKAVWLLGRNLSSPLHYSLIFLCKLVRHNSCFFAGGISAVSHMLPFSISFSLSARFWGQKSLNCFFYVFTWIYKYMSSFCSVSWYAEHHLHCKAIQVTLSK